MTTDKQFTDKEFIEHHRELNHIQHIAYLEQCLAKAQDAFIIAEMLDDAYDNEDNYDY